MIPTKSASANTESARKNSAGRKNIRSPAARPAWSKPALAARAAAWPAGGGSRHTQGEAQINPDGSIEFRLGVQDIGTGTKTVIAVVAAEMLGLKPEQITVRVGDTNFPPGPGSGGSTTCASVSPTVYDICHKALQQLQTQSGMADARGDNWFAACKKLGVTPLIVHGQWQPGPFRRATLAACSSPKSPWTPKPASSPCKKIVAVHDCGLIIDTLTLESQINGGIIMGMGYALYEERVMDDLSGVVLNPEFRNLQTARHRRRAGNRSRPDQHARARRHRHRRTGHGPDRRRHRQRRGQCHWACACPSLPITPAKVLAALGKVPPVHEIMKAFQYATAHSTDSARELVADRGAYLAGGNDLLGLLKEYLVSARNPRQHQVTARLEQN